MRTIRELASSVMLMARQSGDDAPVSTNQLYLWSTWVINKYIHLMITRRSTGAYLSIFPAVPVVKPTLTSSTNIIGYRKHCVLPASIFDLPRDRGLAYVTYPADFIKNGYMHLQDKAFQYTKIEEVRHIGMGPYSRPSVTNPYYFIYGRYVGFLGIEELPVATLEMGLHTPFDPFSQHNIDDPIPILDQYGDQIAREVFELSRIQLVMPEDSINDGSGTPSGSVSRSNVVSVNNNPEDAVQS